MRNTGFLGLLTAACVLGSLAHFSTGCGAKGDAAGAGGSTTNASVAPGTGGAPSTGGAPNILGATDSKQSAGSVGSSPPAGESRNGGGSGGFSDNRAGSTDKPGASAHRGGAVSTGGSSAGAAGSEAGGLSAGTEPAAALAEPCSTFAAAIRTGTVAAQVDGASGVVSSRKQKGVLWFHGDRGATLYATDEAGKSLGQWEVTNGTRFFFMYNWEDISIQSTESGPDRIWIGDIGNHEDADAGVALRQAIKIMSIDEPAVDFDNPVSGKAQIIDELEYSYPDGVFDSEAMAIDPTTGDLYIFSKMPEAPSTLYRARAPLKGGVFERVSTISTYWLTAADFSPSGREFVVRSYTNLYYWARPDGKTWAEVLAGSPEGKMTMKWNSDFFTESITFSNDESGVYSIPEAQKAGAPTPIEFYAKSCK